MAGADEGGSGTDRDALRFVLRLYVADASARAVRAIANVKALCERYLEGRYELEVIDILSNPGRAVTDNLIATPTLIRAAPLPMVRLVGDLSQEARVLSSLDLLPVERGA